MRKRYLTYAILKKTNQLVYVGDVLNGNECGCVCPYCGQPLCAKNEGKERIKHFSHTNNVECLGAIESALHRMAKDILKEQKRIMLPCSQDSDKADILEFRDVDIEKNDEVSNLRPDCIGYYGDNDFIWIEFKKTHAVNSIKKEQIISLKRNCIEIDLKDCELDPKAVSEWITNRNDYRKWICNVDSEDFLLKEACDILYNKFRTSDSFEIKIPDYFKCSKYINCRLFDKEKCYIKKYVSVDLKKYGFNQIEKISDFSLLLSIKKGNPFQRIKINISHKESSREIPDNTIEIILNNLDNLINLSYSSIGPEFDYKYILNKSIINTFQTKQKMALESEVEIKLWKFYKSEDGKCIIDEASCKEMNKRSDFLAIFFSHNTKREVIYEQGLLYYKEKNIEGCYCCLCKQHSINKNGEIICNIKKSKCTGLFPLNEKSMNCVYFY